MSSDRVWLERNKTNPWESRRAKLTQFYFNSQFQLPRAHEHRRLNVPGFRLLPAAPRGRAWGGRGAPPSSGGRSAAPRLPAGSWSSPGRGPGGAGGGGGGGGGRYGQAPGTWGVLGGVVKCTACKVIQYILNCNLGITKYWITGMWKWITNIQSSD